MPPPATLQDVAKRANVHRSTVALALRNNPRIPPQTRTRIQAVAQQLSYRMDPLVAALIRSRRCKNASRHETIAFVTNYATRNGWRQPYHDRPDYFPGAAVRARSLGYQLEDFWLAEPGMTPDGFCNILSFRNIHGLVIARMPPGESSLRLDWNRFSCVALGMTLRTPQLHRVTENHCYSAREAMRQCISRGYQRIGFIFSEPNDSPLVGDRWLGTYLQQQLALAPANRVPLCPGVPATAATFRDWFMRHEPDALLVTHAPRVLDWLGAMGVAVPRDVGLIELEYHPERATSGVHCRAAEIGVAAVEWVVDLMNRNEQGIPVLAHELTIKGRWHDGGTLPDRRVSHRPSPLSCPNDIR